MDKDFIYDIVDTFKNKTHIIELFCDLAKALDCLNHSVLLSQVFMETMV